MPKAARVFGARPASEGKARRAAYDRRRGSSSERGYGFRWQRAREEWLRENPLCVRCLRKGITNATDLEVDHIRPHRGDERLFWDQHNWQTLCKSCHSRKTAAEDRFKETYLRTVVYGLPGSGKSTYVRDRATKHSLVWDYDVVLRAMTGLDQHELPDDLAAPMVAMLDALVDEIAMQPIERDLWVIVTNEERAAAIAQMLGATLHEVAVDEPERLRRLLIRQNGI